MASVNLQTVAPNQFFAKAVEAYPHLASTIKAVSTGNILVSASQCKLNFVLDNISGVAECTKWTTGAANMRGSPIPGCIPRQGLFSVVFTVTTCTLTVQDNSVMMLCIYKGTGYQAGLVPPGSFNGTWIRNDSG